MEWDIVQLRRHAMNDQSEFPDRPWNYTDKCANCGGVKAFIDWLERESKEWIPCKEPEKEDDYHRRAEEAESTIEPDSDSLMSRIMEEMKRLNIQIE